MRVAFLVPRDDPGVDVGGAGHGRGVAEVAGHLLDDPGDGALAAGRQLAAGARRPAPRRRARSRARCESPWRCSRLRRSHAGSR